MGIIPVIAVFAIVVAICAIWTKSSLSLHRDQLLSEERTQAQWLADAGLRRGAARVAADPDFDGETWVIAAEQLSRASAAAVTIRIEPVDGSPGAVRITARAGYPQRRPRVTVSKTAVFTPPSSESPS